MNKITLGASGIIVSRLCFGTLPLGPSQKGLTPGEGAPLLRAALDAGVNFIDTAEGYRTYPHLRAALAGEKRPVVIASKSPATDYDGMRRSVDKALAEIGRPVIDIFLLHAGRCEDPFRERAGALKALLACRREGLIRAAGISTHFVPVVRAAASREEIEVIHPLVNRSGLGILGGERSGMAAAIATAAAAGKGIYAMKALAGGHLIGAALPALRWASSLPGVHAVAVGMVTAAEVAANAAFFSGAPGLEELFARVEKKQKKLVFLRGLCRGCGECVAACQSDALRLEEGRLELATGRCVLCGYCVPACPQFALRVA